MKGISTKQKLAGYLAGKIFLLGGISNLTTTAKIEQPKPQITAPAVKVIEGKHGQLILDFDDTEGTAIPPSQPVAVKSKTRTTILNFIKEHGSVTPSDLVSGYNLNVNTAKSNLRRMEKEGRIRKSGYGKYELNPDYSK